ncbi:sulfatase-like hydrolase/transferase [Salaquimonas pukyongi]|uniref:sulfatase-like hydrolase/transferase n=1 Tax=Salaquimonas pukyongi TaxID=2712698 RepID=UPI0009F91BB6|nr:sulfatase-like hydrolase/transferase [Salaquimonas pukyongi]
MMNFNNLLVKISFAASFAAFCALYGNTVVAENEAGVGARSNHPNLIVVMADDLGYGDLQPYGQTRFATPVLQQMADEGVLLTDFYSGSTVCHPAREALLRGRHAGRISRQGNSQKPLKESDVTIAEVLRDSGYKTAMIGKWALGNAGSGGEPNYHGFQHWFGLLSPGGIRRYFPSNLERNGVTVSFPDNFGDRGASYTNHQLRNEAIEFIGKNRGTPFFIYLPLFLPHADITAPADTIEEFSGRFPETPYPGGHYVAQPQPNAAFAAMVTEIDRTMEALFGALAKAGIDNNTLVIFTSDNGPVAVGGRDPEFFNSAGGLRGAKRDLYEGGIRVPFIARWPGHIPAGRTSALPASFEDIFPTILDLAGLPESNSTTGRSIWPALSGRKETLPERRLYWAWAGRKLSGDPGKAGNWGKQVFVEAVRFGRWKAHRFDRSPDVELYDLQADRSEKNNLAVQYPDIVEKMIGIMEAEFRPD